MASFDVSMASWEGHNADRGEQSTNNGQAEANRGARWEHEAVQSGCEHILMVALKCQWLGGQVDR